ncbi:MAG TPA: GIY-YIG nuclease family protein, partial [Acidobacteriaceae bacterium]
GVTSDPDRRIFEHHNGIRSGFASKYHCTRLLLIEHYGDIRQAIARETQLKGWTRAKKLALVQVSNPTFKDLAEQWGWLQIGPYRSIAAEDSK